MKTIQISCFEFWSNCKFWRKSYVPHTTIYCTNQENTKCCCKWRILLYCTDTANCFYISHVVYVSWYSTWQEKCLFLWDNSDQVRIQMIYSHHKRICICRLITQLELHVVIIGQKENVIFMNIHFSVLWSLDSSHIFLQKVVIFLLSIQHFTSTLVVTLYLCPLCPTDRVGVEPH